MSSSRCCQRRMTRRTPRWVKCHRQTTRTRDIPAWHTACFSAAIDGLAMCLLWYGCRQFLFQTTACALLPWRRSISCSIVRKPCLPRTLRVLSLQVLFDTSIDVFPTLAFRWFSIVQHDAENLDSKRQDNNERTVARAGINIPSPLLCCPQSVYEGRMKTRSPEKERSCPGEICKKLIMQTPCTQQTDC